MDGGYIVTGYTRSFGGDNVYLIKTDSLGDTLWTRTYGDTVTEEGYSVQQTTDGGYIITGGVRTPSNGADVLLIKTNQSGDTLWTRTYGGASTDIGYSVQQTLDRGYIVAGLTTSYGAGIDDAYLIKTDSLGATLWTRTYGGPGYEGANFVRQSSDSGYIVTGWTDSFGAGATDVYLIKTNASGDSLWTMTYGGTSWDEGWSVQQTSDGGYIIAGESYSFGGGVHDKVYLIKTNAAGDTLWTRFYGGTNQDAGYSVCQTTDGGYIIAGLTLSFGAGGGDVYLIKTNASGDTLWTRTYGGSGDDDGLSVRQTSDGGYIIAGYTNSFGAGGEDVYLIKTDANGYVGVETPVRQLDGLTVRPLKVTPNPFISFATLPGHEKERFSLYDIAGRKVGTYKGEKIGEGLAAGVYFLKPEGKEAKPIRVVKLQ